ncbi:MAG: formiminoglutamase, partial [Cyclobacteriaceae bacterium]|nr:formiminoglutamase [Cyclobacteriaceae bacterium]
MDLKIFFSPIDESIYEDINDPTSFFRSISIFAEKQPDFKGANIALLGMLEDGGSDSNYGAFKAADEIRKKLYRLKKGFG